MKESVYQKITDILLYFNIREDFHVESFEAGETLNFLQLFTSYVLRRHRDQQIIDGECILYLVLQFIEFGNKTFPSEFINRIIQLFRYTQLKNSTICKLFDVLRVSVRLNDQKPSQTNSNADEQNVCIPVEYHTSILEAINNCLVHDDPAHIVFPGDKDSFLQVSSIPWTFQKGYTLAMWLKIPTHQVSKGFELFRCRSPTMKMDGTVLGQVEEGIYAIKVVMNCEKKGRDEARGKIVLSAGIWHLITVTHCVIEETDRVIITVDGHLEIENELAFPVVPNLQETHWTFGVGFTGKASSITLYEQELPLNTIQFIHSLGPGVGDLKQGVSVPQTSYDSGHFPLGSLSAKGPKWGKWCKITSAFSVTAIAVASNYTVPQTKIGKQYADFIVMVPLTYERETPLLASVTGRCELLLLPSFFQAFYEAGGVLLPIYLFWSYSCHKFDDKFDYTSDYTLLNQNYQEGMVKCLQLLRLLLSQHIDLKEQFLQFHGFHLLGYILSMMSFDSRKFVIDKTFVDCCFDLVVSLGPDGCKGDGIATALQGFLFDFRIWNCCSLPLLQYYLESLSEIGSKAGEYLFKHIGIQRILDIFRIHISKTITAAMAATGNTANTVDLTHFPDDEDDESSDPNSLQQIARHCADEIYKLLMIAKEGAQIQAQRLKSNIINEVDTLLCCLIETNNSLFAERILRVFANIRVTAPSSLQQSLISNRYYDTLIVNLWMKKGFTIEIRTQAIINLFWLLNTELKPLPMQIIAARRKVRSLFIPILASQSSSASGKGGKKNETGGYGNMVDGNKLKVALEQLKMLAKPIPKHWKNLMMINDVMLKALDDGLWGNVVASCLPNINKDKAVIPSTNNEPSSQVTPVQVVSSNELHIMLSSIIGENQDDFWLLLPFLPGLLSRIPLEISEKIMMQLHLQFKTDECQCEAINCIEDKLWLYYLLDVAFIGIFQNNYHEADFIAITWTQLPTYTELALDVIATILEYKIKFCAMEGFGAWMILRHCIYERCQQYFASKPDLVKAIDRRFMKRCTVLVLQRLSKTTDDGWTPFVLDCLDNILQVLQENILTAKKAISESTSSLLDLDDIEGDINTKIPYLIKHDEDLLLISLLMDINEMIRKSCKKFSYFGHEWIIFKRSFKILIESMHLLEESSMMSKFSLDIMNLISKLTEHGNHGINKNEFTQLIFDCLLSLESMITNPVTASALRAKCNDMVFTIVSFFSDLRVKGSNNPALIPRHVDDVLKKLLLVEHITDIELLFAVLRTSLDEINHSVISFEESDETATVAQKSAKPIIAEKDVEDKKSTTSGGLDNKTSSSTSQAFDLLDDAVVIEESVSNSSSPETTEVSSENGKKTSPVSDVVLIPEDEKQKGFLAWLKVRQGIIADRVDMERSRLSRAVKTQDANAEATKKYWKKARRKTESEYFLESHRCQWKLGIAHEGQFYGRKRLVLRPRFEFPITDPAKKDAEINSTDEADISTEELNKLLAKEYFGYIKDVTRDGAIANGEKDEKRTGENNEDGEIFPGTGWGIVDADGSEDGFGVIGIAKEGSSHNNDCTSLKPGEGSVTDEKETVEKIDPIADLIHTEEALNAMKGVIETGPSHSGTSRADAGPTRLETKVVMVTASGNCWGYLQLNDEEIFFRSSFGLEDARKEDNAAVNIAREQRMRRRRWRIDVISAVYLRRYRLRESAIEIFFRKGKHRNVFFDFGHTRDDAKMRNEFAKAITAAAPNSAFKQTLNMSPFRMVYEHGIQEKWVNGKMSNFDYLMALNTIAGRSYNDLCQYPVMPWILSDYDSEKLDLTNPSIYRDLSKPMGALNETRLKEFLDRFYSFEENVSSGIPAFMYGSHYSTMVGVVLHFLVRLQPFASLHKEMQNGHFDVPDRLFSSIPRSYYHNTTQLSEVKEITPEWFTSPDMFRNINNFDFGLTQDGESIADVELPKWCKSAEDFVKIHREALESDYVSEHLHEWIDLIFGYKQRGPDAIEANNVFYYLTYYGSVDHYAIQDETIRKATELQIAHFGQVPLQLFKIPHPARKVTGPNALLPITRLFRRSFAFGDLYRFTQPRDEEEQLAFNAPSTLVMRKSQTVVVNCAVLVDRVMCILDNGVIEMLKYCTSDEAKAALASYNPPASSKSNNVASSNAGPGGAPVKRSSTATSNKMGIMDDLLIADNAELYAFTTPSIKDSGDATTTNSNASSRNLSDENANPTATAEALSLRDGEVLIHVDKEYIHFETVPRIPIIKSTKIDRAASSDKDNNNYIEKLFKAKPAIISCESNAEFTSKNISLSRSCKLCFSIGNIDGAIAIREMDLKTGFIKSCADYYAHKRKVLSISIDTTPDYQIIASCDEGGLVLVWTIIPPNPSHANRSVYAISRRPQRLFRIEPHPDMHVEISWQMGIVIAVTGITVKIFSIERNELLRTFIMKFMIEPEPNLIAFHGSTTASSPEEIMYEWTVNGPYDRLFGKKKYLLLESDDLLAPKYITRRFVVSDYGILVVHMEAFIYVDSLLEYEDQLHMQHLLVAYTISGVRTAIITPFSPVTCLVCPDRGEVVIAGHRDGSIVFYQAQDLTILHKFQPSTSCIPMNLSLPGGTPSGGTTSKRSSAAEVSHGKSKALSKLERPSDTTAIISISVGPNRSSPAVICATTEAGNVYFKALPDFIKWERNRSPSALAQLASVPLQAVKGTLIQAQNWTAETAGVFAQNARSLADEALTELKKVRFTSVFSFSFFL